jgi:hypothetical protein
VGVASRRNRAKTRSRLKSAPPIQSGDAGVMPSSLREGWWRRHYRLAWSLVTVAATLLGLLAAVPRIEITPLQALDPAQPFSVPNSIRNAGFFPVFDLSSKCILKAVRMGPVLIEDSPINMAGSLRRLSAGSAHHTYCRADRIFGSKARPTAPAVITFSWQFRPIGFIPWHVTEQQSFLVRKGVGSWHWTPYSHEPATPRVPTNGGRK